MQKRKLGMTDLSVSAIGFGAIKLPELKQEEVDIVLNKALDKGVNLIDTARNYGDGDSEQKIGNAVRHRRDEFYISSKTLAETRDEMLREIEKSLSLLQTDYIDIYMCHNLRFQETYKKVMGKNGALEGLKEAKEQGMIGHIGFSSHRYLETMEKGINSGEFEVIMVAYNVLNDELVDRDILPLAKEKDMGVMIMKPLAGGVLVDSGPDVSTDSSGSINAEQALKFILANDAVSSATVGMTNVSELEENVKAGISMIQMTEEEKEELIQSAELLEDEVCRGCGYCQPCPQGIRIPSLYRYMSYYKQYDLKDWARGRYGMVEVKADECIECGECEEKCPYDLSIREMLKEASNLLVE